MKCGGFRVSYRSDERIFDTALPIVGLVLLLAGLAVFPPFATTYWMDVLNRIGIAIIGAIGLNILLGFTGQISIGHAAFLAVGAYSTAILEVNVGLPFFLAIPLGALITSGFGLIFGIPSLRLKGLYLAIATLSAHFITTFVIVHWESMTKGVVGLSVPPAVVFGLPLDSDFRIFYLIYALVVPAILFAKNLFRTRVGRAFIAVRDRDVAASVMGVSLLRYKLLAFIVSSFYAGVAGGAHGASLAHPLPRLLHPARGHRLLGDGHHRRHGQYRRLHLRGDLHDAPARGAEAHRHLAHRSLPAGLRLHRLRAGRRVRPRRDLLPDV
jgi:branched-chain amino acid transport system permease protein